MLNPDLDYLKHAREKGFPALQQAHDFLTNYRAGRGDTWGENRRKRLLFDLDEWVSDWVKDFPGKEEGGKSGTFTGMQFVYDSLYAEDPRALMEIRHALRMPNRTNQILMNGDPLREINTNMLSDDERQLWELPETRRLASALRALNNSTDPQERHEAQAWVNHSFLRMRNQSSNVHSRMPNPKESMVSIFSKMYKKLYPKAYFEYLSSRGAPHRRSPLLGQGIQYYLPSTIKGGGILNYVPMPEFVPPMTPVNAAGRANNIPKTKSTKTSTSSRKPLLALGALGAAGLAAGVYATRRKKSKTARKKRT